MSLNVFLKRLLGLFGNKYTCHKLQRPGNYQARYKLWLGSSAFTKLTTDLYKAYHYKKAGIQCQQRSELIQEPLRAGVVFFYNPEQSAEEFTFLFDYLKDQTLQQGYQLHNSDRRKLKHEVCRQQTEAYQLTPKPADVAGTNLCNQLYGNILIELSYLNKQPAFIRFTATAFADKHFSAPLPFDELLKNVLHPTENQ